MPLPHWNHAWAARDVAGYKHSEIIAPYLAALYERVCSFNLAGAGAGALTVAAGDILLRAESYATSAPDSHGWGYIQSQVVGLAQFFARKVDGGGAYSPQAQYGIDSALQSVDGAGVLTQLPFPWPNGFTRKFPREIWKLAYPGSLGQRARFSYRNATTWYSDLTTANPATTGFGTAVTTPGGQEGNTVKLFDHDGVSWNLSADQASDPDVVTEQLTGVGGHGRVYLPGDYFGPWVLNDLRDALNQLTICPATYTHTQPVANAWAFANTDRGLENFDGTLAPHDFVRSGVDASAAAAATAYNADAGHLSITGGSGATWSGPDLSSNYHFVATAQGVRSSTNAAGVIPGIDWPNPLGQNCQLSFWIRVSGGGGLVFNAYGSGVLEDLWAEVAARTTVSDVNFYTQFTPVPATAPAAPPSGTSEGWTSEVYAILADYEVTGGFAYTASTP